MQSKLGKLFTMLAAGVFATGSLWAADFYVAPDGNDNNPGTLEKPFKDPGRAVKELMPGDTLHFRAGTYSPKVSNHISLAPVCSGEKGKPITLRNYENEHVKIVVPGLEFGLSDNGYSWIVFDGFEVVAGVRGFRFGRGMNGKYGHHITVRNCEVHSASREQGLFAQGVPFLTIENNVFRNQKRSHGMYVAEGCHNAVIRNNTSMHNRGNSALQLRGGVTNMLVENNLFFGNAQGISLSATVKNSPARFRLARDHFRSRHRYSCREQHPRQSDPAQPRVAEYLAHKAALQEPDFPQQHHRLPRQAFVQYGSP